MDNDDAKHMLLDIRRRVLAEYPLKDKNDRFVDPRYAMAFGMIAGTITEAIRAVQQDRPMNIKPALAETIETDDDPV